MSRPIKFRAWDTNAHEMTDGFWLAADGSGISYLDKEDLSTDPEYKHTDLIVMQFTGLQDKNGTDIYEGDILGFAKEEWYRSPVITKERLDELDDYRYTVLWLEDEQRFSMPSKSDVEQYCEVIGNIHEHPHLLEEPKE